MNETIQDDLSHFTVDAPRWVQAMCNDIVNSIETVEKTTLPAPSGQEKFHYQGTTKKKFSQNLTETFWQPKLENGLKKVHLMRVSLSRTSDDLTHVRIFTSITDID